MSDLSAGGERPPRGARGQTRIVARTAVEVSDSERSLDECMAMSPQTTHHRLSTTMEAGNRRAEGRMDRRVRRSPGSQQAGWPHPRSSRARPSNQSSIAKRMFRRRISKVSACAIQPGKHGTSAQYRHPRSRGPRPLSRWVHSEWRSWEGPGCMRVGSSNLACSVTMAIHVILTFSLQASSRNKNSESAPLPRDWTLSSAPR